MLKLKYTIKDMEARRALDRLADRMSEPQQALKECGLVLLRSIAKTFKQGGRPVRWKSSGRSRRRGGKTLIHTARLMRSITMQVQGNTLSVGTNVKYAAVQHLGIDKNVHIKEHWRYMRKAFGREIPGRRVLIPAHERRMTIPARPFLVIQDQDWRVFDRILGDHLTGKA